MSSEEVQALYVEAQHLEAQNIELARRESSLSAAHHDAIAAAAALRGLEAQEGGGAGGSEAGAGGGMQALVPLGMGTFIKATVQPGSGIVVSIGAGAAVEKDARSALNFVEGRIKEIEVALQGTRAGRAEVAGRFEQVQQALGSMVQRAPQPPQAAAARAAPRPEERA